jgi:hypothetical protein
MESYEGGTYEPKNEIRRNKVIVEDIDFYDGSILHHTEKKLFIILIVMIKQLNITF